MHMHTVLQGIRVIDARIIDGGSHFHEIPNYLNT